MYLRNFFLGLLVMASGCTTENSGTLRGPVDLSSWEVVGDTTWRIAGDAAAAGPDERKGFIVSPTDWSDFRITLEYKVEDATNSGIYIRCNNRTDIVPDNCYEINIWDNHPSQASRTGSLVGIAEPLAHINGLDRWISVEISAKGPNLKATLDGKLVIDLSDEQRSKGSIALQYGGTGKLEFRKVSITSDAN